MAVFKTTQPVIISILLFFSSSIAAHAASATFRWTPNNELVSGYKIHYGTSSRNYTSVFNVNPPAVVNGMIEATVPGLLEGKTYYFAATAYSAIEESGYSTEIVHTVPGTATPQPPVAGNVSLQGKEDTPLSGQLNANDPDGDALVFAVVAQPGHGTVTVKGDTGSFTYIPALNYFGSDTFSYKVSNSVGASNLATVTINVSQVNDAPLASSTSISLNENASYSGQLTAKDVEGSSLTYVLVAQAGNGTVNLSTSGFFNYIPQQNYSGSDSFTFKVSDGSSTSNTAQVNIAVQHVNKAPITESSSFTVDQGVPYSGQLVATDEDGDKVSFATVTAPEKGTLLLAGNGSFTYTPYNNTSGPDHFTFLATDGNIASNQGTVNILINEAANNDLAFELGELLVTSDWQHVDFDAKYMSPSVIAKSTTTNDPESGVVSIRNLTSTGFDIRIREWDYLDGLHPAEMVSYIVMERGHHQLADNVYAVAECTALSGLNTFKTIKFANSLSSQPVVLSSIVSENDTNTATLRMKGITPQGFSVTMQEQEKNDGKHATETVCYIAMEKWSGEVDGLMIEAGTTEKILTDKASTISFEQQFSAMPFVLADMQSANGMDTAIVSMSDISVTDTRMTIVEEQSANNEVYHIAEIGGYFAIAPVKPEEDSPVEMGETSVGSAPVWVSFTKHYKQPVIIANTVTKNDTSPNVVRISNITEDGFNIQLQEYDYQDNIHGVEIVNYIVMEEGSYILDDGSQIEAGLFNASASSSSTSLISAFSVKPVILTSINSKNGSDAVIGRVQNITSSGFDYKLQEQEVNSQDHGMETVAYLAWTPGSGVTNGIRFQAGTTSDSVTHANYSINFDQQFDDLPFHFAAMQTTDGYDTSALKIAQAGIDSMAIMVEEETSKDSEIYHTAEVGGFLIIKPE
ncbi:fibronectin type III domain-containing protein [Desulfosediminicola flagellatus]|uniref:fibronectin type III domain-containing protein n=1 Tax=Desulfosediminicola flagellatus TaxID=2569541 RepID=UPI0010ACA090|nr:fibronectin type III domain-containing protein [Desulfosediminicola flagellatus]